MARVLDTQAFLDTVCDLLREGQTSVPIPVTGGSMIPFFYSGDTAYLDLLTRPPKRGDIVLYTRKNGRYILHRIYRVREGKYDLIGDGQLVIELGIGQEQILATVCAVRRKGKLLRKGNLCWEFYEHIWLALVPWRGRILRVYAGLTPWRKRK